MNKIIRFMLVALLAAGLTAWSRSAAHAQGIIVSISPSGTITTSTPTYTWARVDGATQYELQLSSQDTTIIYTKTVNASDCGAAENCVTTPTTTLVVGSYTWQVRAMLADAWQDYSAATAFTLINPIPTPIAPSGMLSDTTPTYTWAKIYGASQYQVQLFKSTALVYTRNIPASACGSSTNCVSTPTIVLPRATYSWKVRAMTVGTWQAFSPAKIFTIVPIPTPISPGGLTPDTTPTFTWTKISGASQYQYQLFKGAALVYTQNIPANTCGSTTNCVNTPTSVLPLGYYHWKVRAMLAGAWQIYSAPQTFTLDWGFNSQFTTNASGWTPLNGSWTIANGDYTSLGLEGKSVSSAHIANYTNFTYEVKMMRTGCVFCANSLYFRGSPAPLTSDGEWNNTYKFGFTSDGNYFLQYRQNGVYHWIKVWTYSASIHKNDWNTLKIVMQGAYAQFFINGTRVMYGNLPLFNTGRVGVGYSRDVYQAGDMLYVDYATLTSIAPASSPSSEGINLNTLSPLDATSVANPNMAP
jgi:hypothetical protein